MTFCNENLQLSDVFWLDDDNKYFLSFKVNFKNTWWVFNCWFYIFVFNLLKFLNYLFIYLFIYLFWRFYLNTWFYVSGLVKYDPMRAFRYLPLPKELKAKYECLNIQNNVKKCFLWSILGSLHLDVLKAKFSVFWRRK